jgi:hypothetical protein
VGRPVGYDERLLVRAFDEACVELVLGMHGREDRAALQRAWSIVRQAFDAREHRRFLRSGRDGSSLRVMIERQKRLLARGPKAVRRG